MSGNVKCPNVGLTDEEITRLDKKGKLKDKCTACSCRFRIVTNMIEPPTRVSRSYSDPNICTICEAGLVDDPFKEKGITNPYFLSKEDIEEIRTVVIRKHLEQYMRLGERLKVRDVFKLTNGIIDIESVDYVEYSISPTKYFICHINFFDGIVLSIPTNQTIRNSNALTENKDWDMNDVQNWLENKLNNTNKKGIRERITAVSNLVTKMNVSVLDEPEHPLYSIVTSLQKGSAPLIKTSTADSIPEWLDFVKNNEPDLYLRGVNAVTFEWLPEENVVRWYYLLNRYMTSFDVKIR